VRSKLLSVLIAALSFALFIGVLEAGVRIFVPKALWRFRDPTLDWRRDPVLGWVNRPDLDVYERSGAGWMVHYRTNPDGLVPADARPGPNPETFRLMVVGDSMVVGRQVPQDLIYTARLEALLRERGVPAEVINAGVQGYSTDQALLWMERLLPLYQPDAVAYGSTLNDFGGNSSREAYRQTKPMFVLENGRLRLIEPEIQEGIHRVGRGLRSLIQNSAFYRMIQPRLFSLRARIFGDWRERNLLGFMQAAYLDPTVLDDLDWDLYGALLSRMQSRARAHRADFFFFSHPEIGETWKPYIESMRTHLSVPAAYDRHAVEKRVRAAAERAGVDFVGTIDYFVANQERGPFHLLPTDPHLSAAGHELLAEELANYVMAQVLPRLKRREAWR
jgi:lysophospholipase L1-like esterase